MKCRPYAVYKDSGVEWLGEIPSHWEVKRLKQVARLMYGDSLPVDGREDGGVPVYGSNGIVGYHSTPNTRSPALIIGRKGSYGKVNYSETSSFAIDTTYFIDERTSSENLRWFYYALQLLGLDAYSEDSAVPGLSRDYVYSRVVPVPLSPEQQAIAAFLDRETAKIDALVAKKERLIELLQETRAAFITHAVTKGLNPSAPLKDSGVEWLGRIPTHWEACRLKFLTSFVTSGSRGWADYYSRDGAAFLRIGNVSRAGIDLELDDIQYVDPPAGTERQRTMVQPGDVLISITAYIGSVGVVPGDLGEAYVNQHLALVRPRGNLVLSRWVAYWLRSKGGQRQFRLLLYGGTKDGLGLDDVKNLAIVLPPLHEQEAITKAVDDAVTEIDAVIAKVREAIERLRERRAALISAAVTGKIDVREEAA